MPGNATPVVVALHVRRHTPDLAVIPGMNPAAWANPPGEGITAGITATAITAVARPATARAATADLALSQGPSSPKAHANSPTRQIDLFCTNFAIMLHKLLPAPNGG